MSSKDKKILKQIGQKVAKFRKREGLSQAQLAFEAGITRLQVSRNERGEHNSGLLYLVKIAPVLGVEVKDFL